MRPERILVGFLRSAQHAFSLSLPPLGSPLLRDGFGLFAGALAVIIGHVPIVSLWR
jgi:hypothetical protein